MAGQGYKVTRLRGYEGARVQKLILNRIDSFMLMVLKGTIHQRKQANS